MAATVAPETPPAVDTAPRAPRRRRGRRLLVFALTVVALEGVLRALLGNYAVSELKQYDPGDGRCVGLRPGAEVVYTGWLVRIPGVRHAVNRAGYRGPVRPRAKPAGTTRLLLVGDSYAFGQGAPADATVAAQLEAVLGRQGQAVEVLNFGVEALNLEEVLEQYELFASRWEHDGLLYLMSANDLTGRGCDQPEWFPKLIRGAYVTRIPLLGLLLVALIRGGEEVDPGVERDRLVAGLERFRLAAAGRGARFGAVSLGDPLDGKAPWIQGSPVPVLDASRVLQERENRVGGEGHLNERGGRRVAELVAGWLPVGLGLP